MSENESLQTSVSAVTLTRRREQGEFEVLRDEMLRSVQRLSSHSWTDYNLHDPGVTILEQLCYLLTDINHRSRYGVESLLADENNKICLDNHGMYKPQVSLHCRPVTLADKTKYLLNALPELSRIEIVPVVLKYGNSSRKLTLPWLVKIVAHTRDAIPEATVKKRLKDRIECCYHKNRNLTEDLYSVEFASDISICIEGRVYIEDWVVASGAESELLAKLYVKIQCYLLGEVQANDLKQGEKNNAGLQQKIPNESKYHCYSNRQLTVSGLIAEMSQVPGVLEIDGLKLWRMELDSEKKLTPVNLKNILYQSRTLRLHLPEMDGERSLQLMCRYRKLLQDSDKVRSHYISLREVEIFKQRAERAPMSSNIWDEAYKNLCSYTSIVEHFPGNYGVNRYGLPSQTPPIRKALASQLQGYLLLFDQLVLDHLGLLEHIKKFASQDLHEPISYPSQNVTENIFPAIELLQIRKIEQEFLSGIEAYDDYDQRKLCLLEYLCAMNGRDREIYGWEYRNPYFSEKEKQQRLLVAKRKHLKLIHNYSANRAGAFNYKNKSWGNENISCLEKRLRVVLGVSDKHRSTVYPFVKQGFSIGNKEMTLRFSKPMDIDERNMASAYYRTLEQDYIESNAAKFKSVPLMNIEKSESWKTFQYVRNYAFSNIEIVQSLIFEYGSNIENYQILSKSSKDKVDLFVNMGNENRDNWFYLMSYSNIIDAGVAANHIRNYVQQLNLEMEGLHVVEHNLLLPVDSHYKPDFMLVKSIDHYANRISVFLPGWTARFKDKDFRAYVNDLILQDVPAHIYTRIYWLCLRDMERFEIVFKNWSEEKRESKNPDRLNWLSKKMLKLISTFNKECVS